MAGYRPETELPYRINIDRDRSGLNMKIFHAILVVVVGYVMWCVVIGIMKFAPPADREIFKILLVPVARSALPFAVDGFMREQYYRGTGILALAPFLGLLNFSAGVVLGSFGFLLWFVPLFLLLLIRAPRWYRNSGSNPRAHTQNNRERLALDEENDALWAAAIKPRGLVAHHLWIQRAQHIESTTCVK